MDAVFRLGATLKPAWNAAVKDHRYQVWHSIAHMHWLLLVSAHQ